jgi:ABC-type Na+ efflux pump permease subunit
MHCISALIWKDIYLCRLPIIAGIVILLAPFGLAAAAVMNMPLWTEATQGSAWAVLIATGCHLSIMCSQVTLAMVSGSIIAVERSDRSAEFLSYLPVSRLKILTSKIIVLAGIAVVVWGANLNLGVMANQLAGDTLAAQAITSQLPLQRNLAAIEFAAIGAGWFGSSMSTNTGPAVAMAFAAPLAIQGTIVTAHYSLGWPDEFSFSRVYFATCWFVGGSLFAIGTTYFLRRVQP